MLVSCVLTGMRPMGPMGGPPMGGPMMGPMRPMMGVPPARMPTTN